MPIHVAPYFRNKELALEAAGLIVTLNSDGYNNLKNAQAAGLAPTQIPSVTFNVNGTQLKSRE